MILQKIKPNYRIDITKKDTKEKISCSFYSKHKLENILITIDKELNKLENKDSEIYIKIYNNKIFRTGFFKEFYYDNVEIQQIKNHIMEILTSNTDAMDVKSSRYQLVVRNTKSQQLDVKYFSFNSNISDVDAIIDGLKDEIVKKFKELGVDEIQFGGKKSTSSTHYLTVYKAGTNKDRENAKSKTFSIYFPEYSSLEIIKILKGENIEQ